MKYLKALAHVCSVDDDRRTSESMMEQEYTHSHMSELKGNLFETLQILLNQFNKLSFPNEGATETFPFHSIWDLKAYPNIFFLALLSRF